MTSENKSITENMYTLLMYNKTFDWPLRGAYEKNFDDALSLAMKLLDMNSNYIPVDIIFNTKTVYRRAILI